MPLSLPIKCNQIQSNESLEACCFCIANNAVDVCGVEGCAELEESVSSWSSERQVSACLELADREKSCKGTVHSCMVTVKRAGLKMALGGKVLLLFVSISHLVLNS